MVKRYQKPRNTTNTLPPPLSSTAALIYLPPRLAVTKDCSIIPLDTSAGGRLPGKVKDRFLRCIFRDGVVKGKDFRARGLLQGHSFAGFIDRETSAETQGAAAAFADLRGTDSGRFVAMVRTEVERKRG